MQNQKAVSFHSLPQGRGSHSTFIIEHDHELYIQKGKDIERSRIKAELEKSINEIDRHIYVDTREEISGAKQVVAYFKKTISSLDAEKEAWS